MGQSLSNILVHVVFSTKERRPWIHPKTQNYLYGFMSGICNELESPCYIINGMEDHVHLLLLQSRKIALADLVGKIKSNSSRWMKANGVDTKAFTWQSGFGAFSIGQSMFEQTYRYIANQKQHHQNQSFQDEFVRLLKAYKVFYNETYLWD